VSGRVDDQEPGQLDLLLLELRGNERGSILGILRS
jgi:hypothetical protein